MNWLITGGCGFIGTSLIRRLVPEGRHGVRVVDDLSVGTREDLAAACSFEELAAADAAAGPPEEGSVQLVVADVRDADVAARVATDIDVIVHLAAQSGVAPSVEDPRGDCLTNVVGTLNYLEAARHAGVGRFVHASSGAALGEVDPPLHEAKVPRPVSPYGASKAANEMYLSAYARTFGIETVGLRFGNVYGPGSGHKVSVVAKFIRRAMRGQALEIYGDGTQTRDYIFTEDLVRAIRLAATASGIGGEVFQIATSHETSVNELVDLLLPVLAEVGVTDVEVAQAAPRRGDVQRNYADTSKAERLLGWRAEVELPDGLRRTVDWFLAEQADPRVAAGQA